MEKDFEKEFPVEKVSITRARIYLWLQNVLDVVRRRRKGGNKENVVKNVSRRQAVPKELSKREIRAEIRKRAKDEVYAEREKLYNQFVNYLIVLLVNGIALGGLVLAAFDYVLNAQIPERSTVVLGLFVAVNLFCVFYWARAYKQGKGIEGVRGLASFALTLCVIGNVLGGYDLYKNIENLNTYFQGERIVIKDKQRTAEILAGYIHTWRHTPNYCLVHLSDTAYYATVYNSQGESITQLVMDVSASGDTGESTSDESTKAIQNIAICLKDGTAVIVSEDTVEYRQDVDNLKYVELALQWAARGKADIERMAPNQYVVPKDHAPADAMPGTEYAVILKGLSKVKEFYTEAIGKDAADAMFSALASVGMNVELSYYVSVDKAYLGVAATIDVDGVSNLLWYIDNYTEVYDWSLGDADWYNYDYTDAAKNEKMIQEAVYNATSMLTQYGIDSGFTYSNADAELEFDISEGPDSVKFTDVSEEGADATEATED